MKLLITTLLLMPLTTFANTSTGKKLSNDICASISNNDSFAMHKIIKTKYISLDGIYRTVKCDNKNIVTFAIEEKADDTLDYINRKSSNKLKKIMLANLNEENEHVFIAKN